MPDHQVIHSFWVPQLAGKQDVVPGRTNHILFSVDEPGTYWGQCAEFCGLQHGRMKFRVVALDRRPTGRRGSRTRSTRRRARPTRWPSRAMDLFLNPRAAVGGTCTACHAVGGTRGGGAGAEPHRTSPTRPTSVSPAATGRPTTVRRSRRGCAIPIAVKLGSKMPDYDLTDDEIDALVA